MNKTPKYSNEAIVAALKATWGKVYLAADKLGCSADTIYKRARASKEIAHVMNHYSGHILDSAEVHLARAISKGESWAIRFVLKSLGRKRGYSDQAPPVDPFEKLPKPISREERKAIREYLIEHRTNPDARLARERKKQGERGA